MTKSLEEATEPPSKRIKSGEEFINLIDECYELQFSVKDKSEDQLKTLESGVSKIRDTLEHVVSSSDVSFGSTRSASKINWGKCVSLMLENGLDNVKALKVLTDRLSPGGGLL